MAMMKQKKDDGMTLFGKIITVIFLVLLAAGIYYFASLFKAIEISPITIAGQWKQAGSPVYYITFTPDGDGETYDGTAHAWEQFTGTGEIRNDIWYTYRLIPDPDSQNGNYLLYLKEQGKKDAVEEKIVITQVSRAEISMIRDGSNFETLTKVNLF